MIEPMDQRNETQLSTETTTEHSSLRRGSRDTEAVGDYASAHGLSSSGGQQVVRTLLTQPEGRGSVDGGVPQRVGSAGVYRLLDPGVRS
jgi:hypothetical protein